MKNIKLSDKRVLVAIAILLILVIAFAARGCGKDSTSAVAESNAAMTGEANITESAAAESTSSELQDTTAPGNTQDTASPSDANQEEPVRIIEEEGNIEIIVPEDEETFGE